MLDLLEAVLLHSASRFSEKDDVCSSIDGNSVERGEQARLVGSNREEDIFFRSIVQSVNGERKSSRKSDS